MKKTPNSNRFHIGIYGKTNAGKSSLLNAITNTNHALTSDIKGTTTDPVKRPMELLPLGPVLFIDTAGLDDDTKLGAIRMEKTMDTLSSIDLAMIVVDATIGVTDVEELLISDLDSKNINHIIVYNKCDLISDKINSTFSVSSNTGAGIDNLRKYISNLKTNISRPLISDIVQKGDIIILVTPIDSEAPKGRIILPQQQVLREALDCNCISIAVQVNELKDTINNLKKKPALVITDSQAFKEVDAILEEDINLTSFSVLFARQKGELDTLVAGIKAIENLSDDSNVLLSENCLHNTTHEDIGEVKIPMWLKQHTKKEFNIDFTKGKSLFEFPIEKYDLIIMCGSCMLNATEVTNRIKHVNNKSIPITNYGLFIAYHFGILDKAIKPFKK